MDGKTGRNVPVILNDCSSIRDRLCHILKAVTEFSFSGSRMLHSVSRWKAKHETQMHHFPWIWKPSWLELSAGLFLLVRRTLYLIWRNYANETWWNMPRWSDNCSVLVPMVIEKERPQAQQINSKVSMQAEVPRWRDWESSRWGKARRVTCGGWCNTTIV